MRCSKRGSFYTAALSLTPFSSFFARRDVPREMKPAELQNIPIITDQNLYLQRTVESAFFLSLASLRNGTTSSLTPNFPPNL